MPSPYTHPHKSTFASSGETKHFPSRSAIWAKYSSQSLYKANKTHSCLPTEERYSNNCLPRRLSNPRFFHRRVKGKHLASTDPFAAAGVHHKLGEVDPGSHAFINILWICHRLTDNVTQPSRTKGPEHTEQMSTRSPQPNSSSSRRTQPNRDIGVWSPCHFASPPSITNAADKVPAGLSRPLRDTYTLKQQCSSRHTVVAPECCSHKRQCDQSSSPRPIHNIRRLQNRLGCVVRNLTTNGRCLPLEATHHIHVLELEAAYLAVKAFPKNRTNIVVCFRMDNTTAVAQVNNKGGTRSPQLVSLTFDLWQWCLQKSVLITAQHLPGKLNSAADRESREFYDHTHR